MGRRYSRARSQGLEVFGQAVARFEGFAKQGHISAHGECFAVSGASGGFMLVARELTELTRIMTEEETLALNAKAAAIVQRLRDSALRRR
jgi:hypothetical protein